MKKKEANFIQLYRNLFWFCTYICIKNTKFLLEYNNFLHLDFKDDMHFSNERLNCSPTNKKIKTSEQIEKLIKIEARGA